MSNELDDSNIRISQLDGRFYKIAKNDDLNTMEPNHTVNYLSGSIPKQFADFGAIFLHFRLKENLLMMAAQQSKQSIKNLNL